MSILNELLDAGPDVYYTVEFRKTIEDHMTYLRTHTDTTILTVEPFIAYKYRGDLYRVLHHYNASAYLHWIIMRMNNWTSPTDFNENVTTLMVPSPTVIERMRAAFMAQSKLKK